LALSAFSISKKIQSFLALECSYTTEFVICITCMGHNFSILS